MNANEGFVIYGVSECLCQFVWFVLVCVFIFHICFANMFNSFWYGRKWLSLINRSIIINMVIIILDDFLRVIFSLFLYNSLSLLFPTRDLLGNFEFLDTKTIHLHSSDAVVCDLITTVMSHIKCVYKCKMLVTHNKADKQHSIVRNQIRDVLQCAHSGYRHCF